MSARWTKRMAYSLHDMEEIAQDIERGLREAGTPGDPKTRQIIALAEECGGAVGAARRHLGLARRPGTLDDIAKELADVVITAFVTAEVFDITLADTIFEEVHVIFRCGFRDPRSE